MRLDAQTIGRAIAGSEGNIQQMARRGGAELDSPRASRSEALADTIAEKGVPDCLAPNAGGSLLSAPILLLLADPGQMQVARLRTRPGDRARGRRRQTAAVYIRPPVADDQAAFLAAVRRSRALHRPVDLGTRHAGEVRRLAGAHGPLRPTIPFSSAAATATSSSA